MIAQLVIYMQESWIPKLRRLVAQINETFSRNFKEMAVAGEVSLGNQLKNKSLWKLLFHVIFSSLLPFG